MKLEVQATLHALGAVGRESGGLRCWADLVSARRTLLIGLGLVFLQQVTGQPSVLYYQTTIFQGDA